MSDSAVPQGHQNSLERPRTDRETVKEMALQIHLDSNGVISIEEAQNIAINAGKRVRAKVKRRVAMDALPQSLK